jgi:peptidoglycan/LPS O-acetylase OafA/YrhL
MPDAPDGTRTDLRAASLPHGNRRATRATAMGYRPDIDGLRAVAVLGVIFYHLQVLPLRGGYVGVDIFFVISGYLIGGIIIDETANSSFSYAQFYARRVKRLFAAYFVVALATVPLAWWLLVPADFRALGKALVASTVFLSNLLFYKDVGYFDATANTKALLHTWTLAVEEQFYVFFPLLMRLAVRASRRSIPHVLAAATLVSLAYSQYLLAVDPAASYYWLPSRGWELLLGALVALPQLRGVQIPARLCALFTWLSAAALLLPMLLYTDATPFPGVAALPCCLGTTWLLWSGRHSADTLVQRALAARIPVGIGRISYSLYLWHWPVYVFINYYEADAIGLTGRVMALLLTFLLAMLSWRFVEQPLRYTRRPPAQVFGAALVGSIMLASIGYGIWRSDGAPGRLAEQTRVIAVAAGDLLRPGLPCWPENNPVLPGVSYCRIGAPTAPAHFLIWGDSHAGAIRDGANQIASENGLGGLLIFAGGCMPAFDIRKQESATGPRSDNDCAAQNAAVRVMLSRHNSIKKVLLVGRWAYYTEGRGVGRDSQNVIRIDRVKEGPSDAAAVVDQPTVVAQALCDTVRWLHQRGYEVYLLEQPPEIPYFTSLKLFQTVRAGHMDVQQAIASFGTVAHAAVEERQRHATDALRLAAAGGEATILATHQLFCQGASCSAWSDSAPAYFDNNHLTGATSRRIRNILLPAML